MKTPRSNVIFSTVHGSHLYGLDHDRSDMDVFVVTDEKTTKARHSFDEEGRYDQCRVGFDTFIRRVFEGSHQSVEALFSPFKAWNRANDHAVILESYISGLRISGSAVFAKYERTIKRFCYGDFKRRRHAARLALNLADLRHEGRFNPVLTPRQIQYCGYAADSYEGDQLWEYLT